MKTTDSPSVMAFTLVPSDRKTGAFSPVDVVLAVGEVIVSSVRPEFVLELELVFNVSLSVSVDGLSVIWTVVGVVLEAVVPVSPLSPHAAARARMIAISCRSVMLGSCHSHDWCATDRKSV
ncbi:hypothetical protein OV079_02890 [Nannocystis pusilla]|uniref:Uncharacterized protein n=1 Tax=Nannocystis pusilla TaxID=889268 RepID=A0A9X3EIY1_9BACT|nr:hypothetical protein [Nannocystis pusilla]MCY1004531.1 hypothetical protein [Nannocystis pusilla]